MNPEDNDRREYDALGDCDYLQRSDFHNWMCYQRSKNWTVLGVFCSRCGRWGRFLSREIEHWEIAREQRRARARKEGPRGRG